jgi:hypothetical protein
MTILHYSTKYSETIVYCSLDSLSPHMALLARIVLIRLSALWSPHARVLIIHVRLGSAILVGLRIDVAVTRVR